MASPNSKTLTVKPSSSTSLAEERLREYNRRPSNAAAAASSNPYLYLRSLGLSPGRESFASSARTSASSSSVLLMIQEWAPPCLSKSNRRKEDDEEGDLQPAGEWDPGLPSPRASRKPLRESDLAPAPQPQAAPVAGVVPHVPVAAAVHGRKEREYVWAYKYRPRSLDEFICNKDRVEELKEMVSSR